MKVLKSGNKFWHQTITCNGYGNSDIGCGATLQIEEGDLYKTYTLNQDQSINQFFTIRCCECFQETDIDNNLIPEGSKEFIMDKIHHPSWVFEYENNKTINDSFKHL